MLWVWIDRNGEVMRKANGIRLGRVVTAALVLGALGCSSGEGGTMPPPLPPPGPPPPEPPPSGATGYQIVYATYLGGSGFEEIREPLLLSGSRLLFGARTLSSNMPVGPGAYQPSHGGGMGDSYLGILSADGGTLEAGTFFGGSSMERPPYGIRVASGGDVVFTSGTTSPNIPTSANAYRRSLHSPVPDLGDGYVCRISGDLRSLRWCTYTDGGWPRGGLILDGQENVIVTGGPAASNFTPTPGAYQPPQDQGFTLKLASDGSSAIFATLFGGISVRALSSGDLSIIGIASGSGFPTTSGAAQSSSTGFPDAFAAVLSADGSRLVYSTLLGGSANDFGEHPHVVMPDGGLLFGGVTQSSDLTGASGGFGGQEDGFLAALAPDGSSFPFVRFVGGSGDDFTLGPVLDPAGNIYLYGNTSSRNLPTTSGALQASYAGGPRDAFLMVLGPGGTDVRFATYLGGNGDDLIRGVAIGSGGELYLVGRTDSSDFPVTSGAFQESRGGDADGFVIKLVPTDG